MITLIPLSLVAGATAAFLFRTFSAPGVAVTIKRIVAHILELRLFIDEPVVILRAQRDLLRENLRLLGQIAVPTLLTCLMFGGLVWLLDSFYGRAPLRAGQLAVVTAHLAGDAELEAPAVIAVETPAVRIPSAHEVSWSIRPSQPYAGEIHAVTPDHRRVTVDVPWPRTSIFGADWLVWFFGLSTLAALLFRPKAVFGLLLLACALSAAPKPSVILISVDTLRADHLSAYGYRKITTPGIDAYGTMFRAIDSQIPLTLPSHTVLMTSQLPFVTGVESNSQPVPNGAVTLASVLRANGYATAAFVGSVILDKRFGLDQGFDVYDSPFSGTPDLFSARVRRDGSLVLRAARQWMAKNNTQPAFVFIHLFDLHTPYPAAGLGGILPNVAAYDTQLQHVDQLLAAFRQELVRTGWWDKSLVVLLSDHGEGLGDHGESSHGYFLYESTLHVPLIVHPALPDHPGGLIDVAPTILDFLHIAPPPSFSGISLLRDQPGRATFAESVYPRDNFGWSALRSVRQGDKKFISAPRAELYDLAHDPAEHSNLLPAHNSEAISLRALLTQPPPRPQAAADIPAKSRELLRSLGYTSGGARPNSSTIDPKDRIGEQEAYERGLALLYAGNFAASIQTLFRIVTQDPANLPAICALGEAQLRAGNAARAVELWRQALTRDPHYRPAADALGAYWLSRHDLKKACAYVPSTPECSQK